MKMPYFHVLFSSLWFDIKRQKVLFPYDEVEGGIKKRCGI